MTLCAKKAFATRQEALGWASRIKFEKWRKKGNLTVYQCGDCGLFHTTSGKNQPNRRKLDTKKPRYHDKFVSDMTRRKK